MKCPDYLKPYAKDWNAVIRELKAVGTLNPAHSAIIESHVIAIGNQRALQKQYIPLLDAGDPEAARCCAVQLRSAQNAVHLTALDLGLSPLGRKKLQQITKTIEAQERARIEAEERRRLQAEERERAQAQANGEPEPEPERMPEGFDKWANVVALK